MKTPVHRFLYKLSWPDAPMVYTWKYHTVEVGYPGLDHLMQPENYKCHGTPSCIVCDQIHSGWSDHYAYVPAYMYLIS